METIKAFLKKTWPYLSVLLTFGMFFMLGCAVTDAFFGFPPSAPIDPNGGSGPLPPAPSDFIGGLLSTWFPWATGALGALRHFYVEARKRKMDEMFRAVVIGIKKAVDAAGGEPLDKAALYSSIMGARDLYANRELFDRLVDDIKRAYDEEKARVLPPPSA